MNQLSQEEIELMVQFLHPEKMLGDMPGMSEDLVPRMLEVENSVYCEIKQRFQVQAHQAAEELLGEREIARRVRDIPFKPGETIVGLGDSITDDIQSWFEILRNVLETTRPRDALKLVNAGVSGDTTAQLISRFLNVVLMEPDWIICMAGTNDARLHGEKPTKPLVSIEETEKNLAMLRNFARNQTHARWIWITPARVIERQIGFHFFLGPRQLMWRNEDVNAIAELIRRQPDPVVDIQPFFDDPKLLLPDGLHPSLEGHKVIARALIEKLSTLKGN